MGTQLSSGCCGNARCWIRFFFVAFYIVDFVAICVRCALGGEEDWDFSTGVNNNTSFDYQQHDQFAVGISLALFSGAYALGMIFHGYHWERSFRNHRDHHSLPDPFTLVLILIPLVGLLVSGAVKLSECKTAQRCWTQLLVDVFCYACILLQLLLEKSWIKAWHMTVGYVCHGMLMAVLLWCNFHSPHHEIGAQEMICFFEVVLLFELLHLMHHNKQEIQANEAKHEHDFAQRLHK